jgi:hypothetical protein
LGQHFADVPETVSEFDRLPNAGNPVVAIENEGWRKFPSAVNKI